MQWPRVYQQRSERQANSFKRRMDQGARTPHAGRKKLLGPDRHQQRARANLAKAQESATQQRDKKARQCTMPQDTVAESTAHGQTPRLHQRQQTLAVLAQAVTDAEQTQAKLAEHAHAFGPPTERADRAVRQQPSMTLRTLLREHALTSVMAVLWGRRQTPVSLARLLRMLCERRGARMETGSPIVSWGSTVGFSAPSQRLLREGVEGLCKMALRCQGKPSRVRLTEMPP